MLLVWCGRHGSCQKSKEEFLEVKSEEEEAMSDDDEVKQLVECPSRQSKLYANSRQFIMLK